MKLGIVADTHLNAKVTTLPKALLEGLMGVDYILHAGDWMSPHIMEMFKEIAPIDGVAGNNDGEDIVQLLGYQKTLQFAGFTIGMVHGDGQRLTTERRAWLAFEENLPDMIIFGHSHIPLCKKINGTLLFNPGSPTAKRRQPRYSFGIITLAEDIDARLVYYDDKS